MMPARPTRIMIGLALVAAMAGAARTLANDRDDRDASVWRMIGQDPANSRNQPAEHRIGPDNAFRLALKWVATTAGDISATPAVVDGAVYAGDFGGMLWKLDAWTGAVIWSRLVADYTGIAGDIARTSPSLDGNTLVVGDLKHPDMLGIDARSGALLWRTQVHPDPKGIMTGSPVLVGHTIITGVSASGASGPGATFRGAIVALDARTGAIKWRTYSLPDNGGVAGGYAGATMFSPPAVDERLGLVYGTFGQAYTEPAAVLACHAAAANGFDEACEQPGSYLKSIVAFDLETGAPRWSYRVQGHDPWMRACSALRPVVTWCPAESDGEKWDLGGSGVNVMRLKMHRRRHGGDEDRQDGSVARRGKDEDEGEDEERDVVGIGEKSGVYVALDAKTGRFMWNTLVGPGGDQGGMEWGTAFDGRRIYISITNHHHIPYRLMQDGFLSSDTVTGGSWAALDARTGQILWQTADPQVETLPGLGVVGVWDLAPVTVANGVLYASSMAKLASQNQMFALDAATGAILWQFGAGSSVNSGPAVADGTVYWGSGYARSGVEGSGNTRLFAFSIDGR